MIANNGGVQKKEIIKLNISHMQRVGSMCKVFIKHKGCMHKGNIGK